MNSLNNSNNPTTVLVHGAWADGSSWNEVTTRLQAGGHTVWVVPNPLRGPSSDAAYVASILNTITSPIIPVAHSYGGAVITNAATGNPNVKALVYFDGFAPDEGETGLQLVSMPPPPGASPSCVSGDPATIFNIVPYAGAQNGDVDLYLKPEVFPSASQTTYPPNRPRFWLLHNAPLHTVLSQSHLELLPGKRSHPGTWSARLIRSFRLTSRSSWPNAPMPKSFRSKRRTHP